MRLLAFLAIFTSTVALDTCDYLDGTRCSGTYPLGVCCLNVILGEMGIGMAACGQDGLWHAGDCRNSKTGVQGTCHQAYDVAYCQV